MTLTFSSAGKAVALIITDGNGRGSSMMYVSGLSKYINKLAGDSSPSWSEDGSALTLKSTDWNNIIVVTGTSVEFSVAP